MTKRRLRSSECFEHSPKLNDMQSVCCLNCSTGERRTQKIGEITDCVQGSSVIPEEYENSHEESERFTQQDNLVTNPKQYLSRASVSITQY